MEARNGLSISTSHLPSIGYRFSIYVQINRTRWDNLPWLFLHQGEDHVAVYITSFSSPDCGDSILCRHRNIELWEYPEDLPCDCLWSSRHQQLPRQRWAWWCQGREGRTRYSLGCSFSEALYLSKETAWIGRRPMYSCRLYYSQLHIIIWNRDTALTLASQTLTQELLTHSGPAGSRSWPSRQTIPWDIGGFYSMVLTNSSSEKLVLAQCLLSPGKGLGIMFFGEIEEEHKYWVMFPFSSNRSRTQRLAGPSWKDGASRNTRDPWDTRTNRPKKETLEKIWVRSLF